MKLSVVIPCLNEEGTIIKVVDDARLYCQKYFNETFEIIVADNGSTDGTIDILKGISDIKVVHVPIRGYGAALHWGIINACGEYVIFGDADMSYPFSNLERFKPFILEAKADMILGSRLRGSIEPHSMPFLNRHFGTPVLTFLIRMIYGIPTSDCNSGMRVIRRTFYDTLNMKNSGMEWASELLLKVAIKNGIYEEIPIEFKKDQRNRPPHLSRWSDGWRHLKTIFLLKPSSLWLFLATLPLMAIGFHFYSLFAFTYLCLSLTFMLFLSLLALDLLTSAIEKKQTPISIFLSKFTIIQAAILISGTVIASLFVVPDEHMGTKLILASSLVIFFHWLFFIETIKTQLVNRLPVINIDVKKKSKRTVNEQSTHGLSCDSSQESNQRGFDSNTISIRSECNH